jgi:hypothetical protein
MDLNLYITRCIDLHTYYKICTYAPNKEENVRHWCTIVMRLDFHRFCASMYTSFSACARSYVIALYIVNLQHQCLTEERRALPHDVQEEQKKDIPIRYDCRCVFCSDRTNGSSPKRGKPSSHNVFISFSETERRALLKALQSYHSVLVECVATLSTINLLLLPLNCLLPGSKENKIANALIIVRVYKYINRFHNNWF